MNINNLYFTPFSQDDSQGKPASLMAHFDLMIPAIEAAFEGKRLQPQLFV
jgi:dipicolinate synthase subunit B